MRNDKLISVIIPVYNVESYLDKCINSVLSQSYANIQVILIDDGSTDDSGKLCDKWKEKDKRITVVHKVNGGLSEARNYGLKLAKGDYFTFIDSDDYVESDYVEYLYDGVINHMTDMSICSYFIDRNNVSVSKGKEYSDIVLEPDNAIERMLNEEGFSVSATAKLYKRELFDSVEFPIGYLCEDNGTTYKLIMKSKKIYYGADAKYHYNIRPDSIMNSFNWEKMDLISLTDLMAHDVLSRYPHLSDSVKRRQVYTRMSVLRQATMCKGIEYSDERIVRLRDYVLNHAKEIHNNKHFDRRDRIGYLSLRLGMHFYAFAWRVYTKIRKE